MKSSITLSAFFAFLFCFSFLTSDAQDSNAGPSDPSKVPAQASEVKQVLCSSDIIKLKIDAADVTGLKTYTWYKVVNGVTTSVQTGTQSTYTETPTAPGLYQYRLMVTNNNDCTSEQSDLFEVYVLPPLNPLVKTSKGDIVCEKEQTETELSIDGLDNRFQYIYQWTKNGTDISGATSATYTVKEQTPGDITFGVKVSYQLNANCSAAPTQLIHVIAVPTKPVISIGN